VSFLYVCLYALIENYTPSSDRSISELWSYAEKYLPSHLIHADPEKAEYLRGETSTLLARLFSKASYAEWFIVELHFMGFGSYSFYPTCHLSGLGSYWLDAQDQNTANWRAETVLHWLLPDQKQGFVDYARSSSVGSDACSFTILLSILVACWSQRWLEPEEIKENDGFPEIAPAILTIYNTMAKGTKGSDVEDILPRVENVMWDHGEPAQVLTPAQSQKLQQTPMWHARVAQALLLKHCYVQAIEHFQISIDENQKAPTFSAQTLSVILRDMSRAYTEVAMHKEALEYLEISDNLRSTFAENDSRNINRPVEALLHRAQMKYRANLTDDAIAIAEEAWNLVLEEWGVNRDVNFLLFFEIFLELGQVHRLRSVFDFASCPLDDTAGNRNNSLDLGLSILDSFRSRPRLMYRVLHYALAQDGQYYLDLTARALKDDETDLKDSTESKYLLATVLFEKGQRDVAVESWYEVASLSSASSNMWDKPSYMRSIGKLVTFCLGDAERLSWGRPPLTLETETELGDICLLLSTWLRDCGDLTYARDALRWCVKQCISLLSDDDPSNDINAFIGLFKVFLVATDSDEDLEVALYLIKQDTEPRMRVSRNRTDVTKRTDDDVQLGLSSTLHHAQLTGWEDQYLEEGNDSYIADVFYAGLVCDPLTECSSCKREIGSMHHWYFCRSCVNSTLCRRCYRQFESDSQSRLSGICNPDHHFYYTGSLLRPSERVPKGMVPLKLPGDEQRIIWVEEWKDRIAEKWDTASFTFDGGLFAWCMRVLPEPQRARWATMFQT
jgi:tetratricopeptide (TPR) repeat protein